MKKICISFFIILIIGLAICLGANANNKYLRIHVRANSNEKVDQHIKLRVKDEVVNYLTPFITECSSFEETICMLNNEKAAVNRLIDDFLLNNGFNYTANVSICKEMFPTRSYGKITLEKGVYDAIIIELGRGKGDNWWCVVYPPLCFSDSENVEYRSKIYEIICEYYDNKN